MLFSLLCCREVEAVYWEREWQYVKTIRIAAKTVFVGKKLRASDDFERLMEMARINKNRAKSKYA